MNKEKANRLETKSERWIFGYEGIYSITTKGSIRKYPKTKPSKPMKTFISQGYAKVCLSRNGVKKYLRVHRLLALTFPDRLLENKTINHVDGDKLNNNISNLEIVSLKNNTRHYYDSDLCREIIGEYSPKAKLKNKDVIKIKRELRAGVRCVALAKKYNVHPSTISQIKRGKSWRKVK